MSKRIVIVVLCLMVLGIPGVFGRGQASEASDVPPETPASQETEAEVLAPGRTDAGAMVFYRDTGYGTEGEEKVQRGFQTADGGFLAIGVTDDAAGGEFDIPDTLDLGAMEHHPELLFGFWMTVALIEISEDGEVLSIEPSEESMWEEYDFGDDNNLWLFREQYDPEKIVESETSYEWDEETFTLVVEDEEAFDGEPWRYGILDGYLFLQNGDIVRVLSGEGAGYSDALVVKVDRDLNLLWQKRFGAPEQFDVGYTTTEVEGGYIVAGGAAVDEEHPQERWMAMLDKESGEILWERHYLINAFGFEDSPDFSADAIHDVIVAENGNLIATGYIASEEYGFSFVNWGGFAFIMEIDPSDGSVVSEYVDIDRDADLRLPTLMMGLAVEEADGGYYVAGDNGFITEDRMAAAISFYDYNDAGMLERQFTSYLDDASAIDMTRGLDDGVVIVGHLMMEVESEDHEEWAPFRTTVTKLTRNPDPTPGEHEEMVIEWQSSYHNPREFPPVDGDHYIRDEVWGVLTVFEEDGFAHDGYIFVAGDGDETDDVHEESPAYDGLPASSTWMSYVGYLYPDGSPDWDEVYYTQQDGEDLGHEAGEYIAATADGTFVIFTDTDNQTDAPNAFGFTEIGPAE